LRLHIDSRRHRRLARVQRGSGRGSDFARLHGRKRGKCSADATAAATASVSRGGVTVTFSRDARGHASICVTGEGYTDEELRLFGEELARRVVQKYVHQRLMDEIKARQFNVVEEEVDENNVIRLKVRHWDE
jgi:hypothetical protein